MKQIFFLIAFCSLIGCKKDQEKLEKSLVFTSADSIAILSVLDLQTKKWNEGDIEGFMQGYWKDPNLSFLGSRGLNQGWQQTLESYKKGYPDNKAMGTLKFDILRLQSISHDAVHLLGKFNLAREKDNPSGFFSLLWRKIDGKWLIVFDQTCG